MDHHTREALGWICRWMLLPAALATGVAICLLTGSGLPGTIQACKSPVVATDYIALAGSKGFPPIHFLDTYGSPSFDYFYGRTAEGKIHLSFKWEKDYATLLLDGVPEGPNPLEVIPTPYSRYLPLGSIRNLVGYPKNTHLLVIDARSLLPLLADGRLSPTALQGHGARPAVEPNLLRTIAQQGNMAYAVAVPLNQYDRARQLLLEWAQGPVLSSSHSFDAPGDAKTIAATFREVGYRLRTKPMAVTEDPVLAEELKNFAYPVFLLGAPRALQNDWMMPVRDWNELARLLPKAHHGSMPTQ